MAKRIDTDTIPLFTPDASWKPPTEFPDLSSVKEIGFDLETRDPKINDMGPGFIRGDAYVVGASVAVHDRRWYFPIAHQGGGNLDRDSVIRFLGDLLSRPDLRVCGANLQYELEGCDSLGIEIRGELVDVQLIEALLDEEAESYKLEALCQKYLGVSKDERLLREAVACYGGSADAPQALLWKLPSKYVGPYAEFDAASCLQIVPKQMARIKDEDLMGILSLESRLLPILWKMRKRGIPVDVDGAKRYAKELGDKEQRLRDSFKKEYGVVLDEWSGPQLASLCSLKGIHIVRTPAGNPSFTADILESSPHPMLQTVSEVRLLNRLRTTFIEDWILKYAINGYVHPQWKQVARDDGGTRSGRMAASNPNPQQVPARSDLAPKLRALFRREEGWAKLDYSQQEPRLMVDYATKCGLTGAHLVAAAYRMNPKLDYYDFLKESCGMARRDSKDATLGRMYMMGAEKFAMKNNIPLADAKQKLDDFDRNAPYVKELSDMCMNLAQQRGYIKTLLGRRRHFNLWEPIDAQSRKRKAKELIMMHQPVPPELMYTAMSYEKALEQYGHKIARAFTYKALNSLIQGSAADMTKAAIVRCYEEDGAYPFMAVHDEGDYPSDSEEESQHLKMKWETCVKTEVPARVDLTHGKHWK